jgi:hypothetical protein
VLDSLVALRPCSLMVAWTVWKYVKDGGRCPLDDWIESNAVTAQDRAKLDARVDVILGVVGPLPPEFLKQYHGTRLHELKVRAMGKQLRPLCVIMPERRIVVLCGAIEKDGTIPGGDLERADNLLSALQKGGGSVVSYY